MNGIISDTHCHNYSQFASVNKDGVNSRLRIILDEIEHCANRVAMSGGNKLFHCGDLFHVRGNVAPSVLNPTVELFKSIVDMGVKPIILCGNHDAEFKHTNELGSAVTSLANVGCEIVNQITVMDNILLCPWYVDKEELLAEIEKRLELNSKIDTVMMHASLDGVFSHIKGNAAIDPKSFFERFPNVKRVFAGHLHKHQLVYEDGTHKAYSVGAICHHNWGDAGADAGFILFDDKTEHFVQSSAPRFLDASDHFKTIEDLGKASRGNYVRCTVEMTDSEVKQFRKALEKYNPAGVTIICHTPVEARADRLTVSSTESLDSIVGRFINDRIDVDSSMKEKIQKIANEIMRGVE